MSNRANSDRSASVSPTSACLLPQCSDRLGMPQRPQILATFTTAGRHPGGPFNALWSKCGWASRISSAGTKKLTSMTRRRIPSVEVANSPKLATPAQLTRTSSPPKRATTSRISPSRAAGSVRSAG